MLRLLRHPSRISPARRIHHGRSDRGAALVELALIVLPVVVIFAGIVDWGSVYAQRVSLRTGAREASWNAGRGIFGSSAGCTIEGSIADSNTRQVMCMAKQRSDLNPDDVRVKVVLLDPNNISNPATFTTGMAVMVCVQQRLTSVTGMFDSLLSNTFQRMRVETIVIATGGKTLTDGEETAFSGSGGWTWCDPAIPAP